MQENEPEIYRRIHKFMLPGDYLTMRLTGQIQATASGLSEGMMWDFQSNAPATRVFEYFGFDSRLTPPIVSTFSLQSGLLPAVAAELGLTAGIPIAYRAAQTSPTTPSRCM